MTLDSSTTTARWLRPLRLFRYAHGRRCCGMTLRFRTRFFQVMRENWSRRHCGYSNALVSLSERSHSAQTNDPRLFPLHKPQIGDAIQSRHRSYVYDCAAAYWTIAGTWYFIPRNVPRIFVRIPRSKSTGSISASIARPACAKERAVTAPMPRLPRR